MIPLQKLPGDASARVLAKCEQFNPGGSIKDRVAKAMIERAEEAGHIGPGSVIVEPTSGNTGVGLAMVSAIKGYRCILIMPDDMSVERRLLLRTLGAEIMLTPAEGGMFAAVELGESLCQRDGRYFMPMQFENEANPLVHEHTTGPEILAATEGSEIHALVCGVGTGGTLTGLGRALRKAHPQMEIVAVEPERSAVLSGNEPGVHRIQGIGAGFVPRVLDRELIDTIVCVSDEDAIATRLRIAREEGINCCISGGAAVHAALEKADQLGPNKTVVTVLPGTGERDLSVSKDAVNE